MISASPVACRYMRWSRTVCGIIVAALLLALLPGRTRIAPLIESDYCYLLMAADRMYEGHGPTALPPVAPFQPWTWQADWGFLTQWPVGYPALVCGLRRLLGLTTIQAFRLICIVGCAAALVGWFAWVRRVVPNGVSGILLAAVAAGCSVSTASLINPTTDLLLVAVLPFVLLLTLQATERSHVSAAHPERGTIALYPAVCLAAAGLAAGGLFWIRYASVFVPTAVGLYLLIERRRRRVGWTHVGIFSLSAVAPIIALLVLNRILGTASSVQALTLRSWAM